MTKKKEARRKMRNNAGRQWVQMFTLSLWSMKRLLRMREGVLKLMRYPWVMAKLSFMN